MICRRKSLGPDVYRPPPSLNDVCTRFCRSWLASEGGLKLCSANENAFAGKPAPTGFVSPTK
jgi:hypothetical protein